MLLGHTRMINLLGIYGLLTRGGVLLVLLGYCFAPAVALEDTTARAWIADMKQFKRGPFKRIRWFCADGSVLPPRPSACVPHGGGHQHGEWSERTLALRAAGYFVANIYADLDTKRIVRGSRWLDELPQMLIEQYLIAANDGWILRRARFYRGAYQEEDERAGARALLLDMLANPIWIESRFLLLRMSAELLPHGLETSSVQQLRQLSATLAQADPQFNDLRNKIHGRLARGDAPAVRTYARKFKDQNRGYDYRRLADMIDAVFDFNLGDQLARTAKRLSSTSTPLAAALDEAATQLNDATGAEHRYAISAALLAAIRDNLSAIKNLNSRLHLLDLSLILGSEHFKAAASLATDDLTRAAYLERLVHSIQAQYGYGLLSARQRDALIAEISGLRSTRETAAQNYKRSIDYLALAPQWGTQQLRRYFGRGIDTLARIDSAARLFVQDQLRASPLFAYAASIDPLVRDANRVSGVKKELFGLTIGTGLRALNPGSARGTLRIAAPENLARLDPNGIYVLPETVAELPPIAGILTAGEGNPLSHVQLLARNLGIPNVAVDQQLIAQLGAHTGEKVLLAVSRAGSVRLLRDSQLPAAMRREPAAADSRTLIEVDLDKLDLEDQTLRRLTELRASDSGRVVGPKAAQLAALKHHYPEAVAAGLTLPFGVFRALLEQPANAQGESLFTWMRKEYSQLKRLPQHSAARSAATEALRSRLHARILSIDPGPALRDTLRAALNTTFGPEGSYGVFVRSDTNVEDLAGFTGAGLNLTVPNVVGFEQILAAISRVWASPFSARSFAWRQSLMDQPEHVYPAVLLMLSVDADKSGVLVTRDIDNGDPNWLSVAINEGVGGAVDGQAAESLRLHTASGAMRLLATSAAPLRRQLNPRGGIRRLPASGAETILLQHEAQQLVTLARELPERFPPLTNGRGEIVPADVEFGFVDGQLRLFQIRPFLDSEHDDAAGYLRDLDTELKLRATHTVSLEEPI